MNQVTTPYLLVYTKRNELLTDSQKESLIIIKKVD